MRLMITKLLLKVNTYDIGKFIVMIWRLSYINILDIMRKMSDVRNMSHNVGLNTKLTPIVVGSPIWVILTSINLLYTKYKTHGLDL